MSRPVAACAIDVDDNQVTLNMTDEYSDGNAVIQTLVPCLCFTWVDFKTCFQVNLLSFFTDLIVVTPSHHYYILSSSQVATAIPMSYLKELHGQFLTEQVDAVNIVQKVFNQEEGWKP